MTFTSHDPDLMSIEEGLFLHHHFQLADQQHLEEMRDQKNRNALSSEVKTSVVIQSNPFTFSN